MAKVGFWLKGAKGKFAGATIYQNNGETVMREIVSPSNPQTTRQTIQRILMHTVMQAYSKLKAITDHSFEGQKAGADNMAYFMKQNLNIARAQVASMQGQGVDFYDMFNYTPLGMKGFTPNQYQISMGSLPSVNAQVPADDGYHGIIPISLTAVTYAQIIEKLGLQRGDQLTFCFVGTTPRGANTFGQNNFYFCRVILDPTNADYTQASLNVDLLDANGKINLPSVRNENTDNFEFVYDAERGGLTFGIANTMVCTAVAVIASREVNGEWLRSTEYMAYEGGVGVTYSLGECMDMAANGNSTVYAANDRYLNNAGTGGGAAAAAGGSSDAGGNSGGNSGSDPTPSTNMSAQSVTMGGEVMTVGTSKNFYIEDAELSIGGSATFSNAPAGAKARIKNNATSDVIETVDISNGTATFATHAYSAQGLFNIEMSADGETWSATGYSFRINESNGDGD